MSTTNLMGRCFCGSVEYRITGEVSEAFFLPLRELPAKFRRSFCGLGACASKLL